jgi:hypothetical protein
MIANPNTVQLITHAAVPTAEITVIDGHYQFVHHAVGHLEIALAPGVYTLQYKAGGQVEEVPVVLRPGSDPVRVPSPRLTVRSPAPLGGNEAGARYGAFAHDCSRDVHVRHGQGGQLFIFLRTAMQDAARGVAWNAEDNRLFQVVVLNDQRQMVVELANGGQRAPDGASLSCNLALNPGTYILRFDAADAGMLEQSVVVSEGWQTQVFASSRPFGRDRHVLGPNLPEAAAFMVRLGAGFNPSGTESLTAESARRALAEGRAVAPEEDLRADVAEAKIIRQSLPEDQVSEMLRMKFANPMLGIYGAHLMLLAGKPDMELLAEVVMHLKTLVGNHPDVMALTLLPGLQHLTEQTLYTLPPMLRSSWKLVVAESVNRPHLVPLRSYSAAIANRTWGAGAWLVWRSPPDRPSRQRQADVPAEQAAEGEVSSTLEALQAYIRKNLQDPGLALFIQQIAKDRRLSDLERTILLYLTRMLSQGIDVLTLIRSPSGLVQALGVPLASLNQALVSLNRKVASTSQEL